MKLQSVFEDDAGIDTKYTGEGVDVSPRLTWSDAPAETQSFALIFDDPDAPSRVHGIRLEQERPQVGLVIA